VLGKKLKKIYKHFSAFLFVLFLVNTLIVFPNISNFHDFETSELRKGVLCYHTDAMFVFVECKSKILSFYLNFISIYAVQSLIFIPMVIFGSLGVLMNGNILEFFQHLGMSLLQTFLVVSQFIGLFVLIGSTTKSIFKKIKIK
jgi:hypothetical protein